MLIATPCHTATMSREFSVACWTTDIEESTGSDMGHAPMETAKVKLLNYDCEASRICFERPLWANWATISRLSLNGLYGGCDTAARFAKDNRDGPGDPISQTVLPHSKISLRLT